MSLQGQRIVVVGGTSGIGLAVAEAAAQEGADVVVASRSASRVESALKLLPEGAEGHPLDVTDEASVEAFFGRVGAFDHLVFTAGEPLTFQPLATMDLTLGRSFLEARLWGTYAVVKHGGPLIREGGSVVLTSGTVARRPMAGTSVAAGLCGAMEALTRALALELAPVRVNAVAPGVVRTDLWRDLPEADRAELYRATADSLPIGRVASPEDIAETYLYLMRGGVSTGSVVVVDGGTVLV
ncbi:SDR family oxidoreductase [Streptomyces sp. NPDC051963]|uniref:SDR family oxidoreductase n=1 Tax=Streptomyces sp. NPDC051963 TaxID=3365678 RepID=UPI0037D44072